MVRFGMTVWLAALAALSVATCKAGTDPSVNGVRTIIIDAGHGGARYPGARYSGVNEKNINLSVALRLGELITRSMPDIRVIYTRTEDIMFSSVLAEDLQARADVANRAHGDLFISIHSNANRSSAVVGTETLIMGETPMETSRNEDILFANNREEFLDMSDERTAAVVRAYIQNLQFTYGEYSEAMARLAQKHFARIGRHSRGVRHQPLKVLYATDMPSILTEIGFMSNPDELRYITSETGQKQIAGALFGAVRDYVDYVRATLNPDRTAPEKRSDAVERTAVAAEEKVSADVAAAETQSAVAAAAPKEAAAEQGSAAEISYTIQIAASRTRKSISPASFGHYSTEVRELRGAGPYTYKYCIGYYSTRKSGAADLARIRETFGGAFMVEVVNDRVK